MHVDLMTTPQPLHEVGSFANDARAAGFAGLLFTEAGRTAYLSAAVAAVSAPGLELLTGVAVAFPRSPMVTAQLAWELAQATEGHFRLGLGTQVRTHVVRRYGSEFDSPGPRLRDYVLAVKASFAAFRGEPLEHRGDFYELTFISPQWSPGPIPVGDPPVDIAAVNPWMLRMAGSVADGVHIHPIGHPGYIRTTALPNLAAGAEHTGRRLADLCVISPVMTIVGDTDEERERDREHARMMIAFYGSTPNYAFIFDEAGFEGTTARIREQQKVGNMAGMAAQISDELLGTIATESTWDGLAEELIRRYGDVAQRLVFYNAAAERDRDRDRFLHYGEVARQIIQRTEPATT